MGANAQTTVPTFVASQVLTADQQNQSARTGVPVFATTVERDAAFGGAGEKTLAEGQLCYLESTNVVQYYDGAAWATVGPATAGGFVRLAGAAFSAVTSVTADNVFSATYRSYQIVFDYVAGSAGPSMQLRVGGVTTSTNYNYHSLRFDNGAVTGVESASQSSYPIGFDSTSNCSSTAMIFRPFDATATMFQVFNARTGSSYIKPIGLEFFGNQSASTSFDGIIISVSSGTMTGRYDIYGLANS